MTARAAEEGLDRQRAIAVQVLPGLGITGRIDDVRFTLGSTRWLEDQGIARDGLADRAAGLQSAGRTISWLVRGEAGARELIGLLAFDDEVRPTSRAAIARLHAMGVETLLISGDHRQSALAIARALGIDDVHAEVMPAAKAAIVQQLRAAGKVVAMVGDGINDAPALAAADVGIAMASGTDVAMETAGITLMRNDPLLVADALAISRRTSSTIARGLFWAFAYNAVGVPLAAAGLLQPMYAGAAMALSSVSVVANALTLRFWHPTAVPAAASQQTAQP